MTGCLQNPSLACKQAPNHDKMAMDVSSKNESSTELSSINKQTIPTIVPNIQNWIGFRKLKHSKQ
jgi:hypothetical protein